VHRRFGDDPIDVQKIRKLNLFNRIEYWLTNVASESVGMRRNKPADSVGMRRDKDFKSSIFGIWQRKSGTTSVIL
jgi:hypothetical protein